MASKTPPQPKRKIADVTKPDMAADVKTPQIVIENRSRIQSSVEESAPTDQTPGETPETAQHIVTAAKSITPPEAESTKEVDTPKAAEAEAIESTEKAEAEPTEAAKSAATPEPAKETPRATTPASTAANIASSSDGANTDEPIEKSDAVKDAEAKQQEEAETRRQNQLNQYIDTKEFFVPINAAAHKRSIEVSLWLTLVYIMLSVILIDLMLDSGMIELLQKVPHTNFFAT